TYRDVIAPGESYQPPLPAKGKEARFTMKFGPEPPVSWRREAVIGLHAAAGASPSRPLVFVDGNPCEFVEQKDAKDGLCLMTFQIPARPWAQSQTHDIKIASSDDTPIVIQRVEVKMRP
ncbi:MAG TPA: hypothetical protein VFW87_26525, partial [Pirellulales bacterium]|nr:hypothetical protein [Pirellulales bacterium]